MVGLLSSRCFFDSGMHSFNHWVFLIENRSESVCKRASHEWIPEDHNFRSEMTPIPGTCRNVFLSIASLLSNYYCLEIHTYATSIISTPNREPQGTSTFGNLGPGSIVAWSGPSTWTWIRSAQKRRALVCYFDKCWDLVTALLDMILSDKSRQKLKRKEPMFLRYWWTFQSFSVLRAQQ